ncbi:MAG TPA: RodZ domain-containing protein [Trebonia sp.]|nr:RodZ domain-containing protein [Trebonia sp.]
MSIGVTLAEARRQAGLTVTQVSQQTRIRESIIRAIEQGDFSPCGGDFYARGHIRSIAEVVGVDPVPLIREYDEEHGVLGGMRASQIFQPATPIRIREPRSLHLGRVLAVVLLAAIGFGAYRFVSDSKPHSQATATSTLRPEPTSKPKPKVTVSPAATPAPAPPKQAVIKLTANSDCWVGINSPTGKSLYQGIIPAGQTYTWDEKQQVSMTIGNPPGITLTVNGKPEKLNPVGVATLRINPTSNTPVTVG